MLNVYNWYKLSRMLYLYNIPVFPKVIKYLIRLIFGCYIPYTAEIGNETLFGYGGIGVVVHDRSVIGKNCVISQGVTLGGTSHKYEVPRLGNNVLVGAGAKIIGPITIGDNAVIGANAVVTKNIPPNTLAVGIPARVIKENIDIRDYR
ncbi:MAG: serine acetyltransferase [uncultured bacterium]|nr:MAG: serine acetyltransferase [uncultured bacterium]